MRMSAWYSLTAPSKALGLPSVIILAFSPMISRMRALSSSVDLFGAGGDYFQTQILQGETIDHDFTPPV